MIESMFRTPSSFAQTTGAVQVFMYRRRNYTTD